MKPLPLPKKKLTRRSFFKHGLRLSALAFVGFGFAGRNNHFMPIKDATRYLAGLVKERYGYTYVNRGIGTLVFPLRIGAPPEITCLTLVRRNRA